MSTEAWKYKIDFGIADIYKNYTKNQKKLKRQIIDIKIFKKILKYYNTEICKSIVVDNVELRFPYRLGYLRIRKFKTRFILDANGKLKTKHLYPNWEATKQLWENNETAKEKKKLVMHTNIHTNGYYYKWYWDKRTCNIKNSYVYSLVLSRTNKRMISKAVKNNDKLDYYE